MSVLFQVMNGMDLHRCGYVDHIFSSDEKHTMFLRSSVFFIW